MASKNDPKSNPLFLSNERYIAHKARAVHTQVIAVEFCCNISIVVFMCWLTIYFEKKHFKIYTLPIITDSHHYIEMKKINLKFSIVTIAYNEEKTIPNLANSAAKFIEAGGEMCLYDTGSTDNTVNVAKELGFKVVQSTTALHGAIIKNEYKKWAKKRGITSCPLKFPAKYFMFDVARNEAAKIASNDMVFFMDGCDTFINFDYIAINGCVELGYENLRCVQKYNHTDGSINRFYHRKKGVWTGHVHEYIICDGVKSKHLHQDELYVCHNWMPKERGQKYLAGLIATHMKKPIPHWYYYTAREFMFNDCYEDAITLFKYSANNDPFMEQRASALCKIAFCHLKMGKTRDIAHEYYKQALDLGTSLREPYFETAEYYLQKQMWPELLKSATGCLNAILTKTPIYFEESRFDTIPHLYGYLLLGYYWAGSKDMAYYYWIRFIEYFRFDEKTHPLYQHFKHYRHLSVPLTVAEISYENALTDKSINTIGNFRHFCNMDESTVTNDISVKDQSFMAFMRMYTSPRSNAIDVFCKKGMHTIDLARIVRPATVHAFESDRRLFQHVNANSLLNCCENIKAYEIDVSSNNSIELPISLFTQDIKTIRINTTDPCPIFAALKPIIEQSFPFIAVYNGFPKPTPIDCKTTNNIDYETTNDETTNCESTNDDATNCEILGPLGLDIDKSTNTVTSCEMLGPLGLNLQDYKHTTQYWTTFLSSLNYKQITTKDSVFFVPERLRKKRVALVYTVESYEQQHCDILLSTNTHVLDEWPDFDEFYSFGTICKYYNVVLYCSPVEEIPTKHKTTVNCLWYPYLPEHCDEYLRSTINTTHVSYIIFHYEIHANIMLDGVDEQTRTKCRIMSFENMVQFIATL